MKTMVHAALAALLAAALSACTQTPKAEMSPSSAAAAPSAASLFPSRWIGEDIAGAGIIDNSHVTLVFQADGSVSGSASCNRYVGQATLAGDKLTFAPLATTQMACAAPALMEQEARYLAVLGKAERVALDANGFLELTSTGAAKPTRFAPDPVTDIKISGTATYRQRLALPPDARLEVRIEDVSLADAPAAVIAEQTVSPAGQVPIAFALTVDPARQVKGHSYAIRAAIYAGRKLLFTTDTRIPALTGEAPERFELVLVQAR